MALVRTSTNSAYQVQVTEYNGKRYFGIAKMFCTKTDPEWRISKQRISFCVDTKDDVKAMITVLKAVKQEMLDAKLLTK